MSVQDESNPTLWLATLAGKMELICPLGTTCRVPQEKFSESHIINPLLTKQVVWSRWLDIGLALFFWVFMDLAYVLVHKHAKIELGQYPAILTSHLVHNPYILAKSEVFKGKCQTETLSHWPSNSEVNRGFAQQPCCMAGTMKIFCI